MKRKFKNQRGESFIETIAAMLIISLAMLMLAGAIVTSARINNRASSKTIQVTPPLASGAPDKEWFVAVRKNAGNTDDEERNQLPVELYKAAPEGSEGDGNALYYYTP